MHYLEVYSIIKDDTMRLLGVQTETLPQSLIILLKYGQTGSFGD
jgi:hypothetical protein